MFSHSINKMNRSACLHSNIWAHLSCTLFQAHRHFLCYTIECNIKNVLVRLSQNQDVKYFTDIVRNNHYKYTLGRHNSEVLSITHASELHRRNICRRVSNACWNSAGGCRASCSLFECRWYTRRCMANHRAVVEAWSVIKYYVDFWASAGICSVACRFPSSNRSHHRAVSPTSRTLWKVKKSHRAPPIPSSCRTL